MSNSDKAANCECCNHATNIHVLFHLPASVATAQPTFMSFFTCSAEICVYSEPRSSEAGDAVLKDNAWRVRNTNNNNNNNCALTRRSGCNYSVYSGKLTVCTSSYLAGQIFTRLQLQVLQPHNKHSCFTCWAEICVYSDQRSVEAGDAAP